MQAHYSSYSDWFLFSLFSGCPRGRGSAAVCGCRATSRPHLSQQACPGGAGGEDRPLCRPAREGDFAREGALSPRRQTANAEACKW